MQPVRAVAIFMSCIVILLTSNSSAFSSVPRQTDQFLDELEKAHFNYFQKYSEEQNGLTMDNSRPDSACSIAAVGFSLSAHIIAAERSYITREKAGGNVLKTLRTLWNLPQGDGTSNVAGYKGFFYHFLDRKTGLRTWNCELSTIDTALLMAGVLSCQTYFNNNNEEEKEIRDLASKLFNRVEWD